MSNEARGESSRSEGLHGAAESRDGEHYRPPQTVDEALRAAMAHARMALSEGLLSGRSLLDAASIALYGEAAGLPAGSPRNPSDARLALAAMANGLDELAVLARGSDQGVPDALLRAILGALDDEIARWEDRSQRDSDARAVLRAFLGLREILWEFGVRRSERRDSRKTDTRAKQPRGEAERDQEGTDSEQPRRPTAPARSRNSAEPHAAAARVQRVEVKG